MFYTFTLPLLLSRRNIPVNILPQQVLQNDSFMLLRVYLWAKQAESTKLSEAA